MMRPVNLIVTAALLFSLAGCGPASEKASHRKTYSEAEQTFIDYMQSEHKLTPVIRRVHNTVWIYQTMEGPLFDFEAQKRVKGTVREQKFKVHYVEGNFTDGTLALDYDISKTFQKKIDTGYGSQYNEEFTKMRMRVYDAVKEAFFDMNQIPGNRTFIDPLRQEKRDRMLEEYIPKVDTPEFFVIVIMNIEEGIGAKSIFYFEDYRRQAMGELPPEEYQLREIN
jgi:hypothetical protein